MKYGANGKLIEQKAGFGVMTAKGSIYCTNGDYYKPVFVGPGGYSMKIWRTREGAQKFADKVGGTVVTNAPAKDHTLG